MLPKSCVGESPAVPDSLSATQQTLTFIQIAIASAHADACGSALFVAFAAGSQPTLGAIGHGWPSELTADRACGKSAGGIERVRTELLQIGVVR